MTVQLRKQSPYMLQSTCDVGDSLSVCGVDVSRDTGRFEIPTENRRTHGTEARTLYLTLSDSYDDNGSCHTKLELGMRNRPALIGRHCVHRMFS